MYLRRKRFKGIPEVQHAALLAYMLRVPAVTRSLINLPKRQSRE